MLVGAMSEKVIIGNATLYCGDCLEILPTLNKVDAVITDPVWPKHGGMFGDINTETLFLSMLDSGGRPSWQVSNRK